MEQNKYTIIKMCLFFIIIFTALGTAKWKEYTGNPVFSPNRAYYPSVKYDKDKFSGHGDANLYKMWYSDTSASHWIHYAVSDNGIHWTVMSTNMTGLTNHGYHPFVLYDENGFGGTEYYYKIWYWYYNTGADKYIYSTNAMHTAKSKDGIHWTNDRSISQDSVHPVITSQNPDWNRGTYVSPHIFYNPSAVNSGTNIFDYSYVMYYDATTGGRETIGIGYSPDGIFWTCAGVAVSNSINTNAWDATHVGAPSVYKDSDGLYHMWYSGGSGSVDDGIGYAVSEDGLNWTKFDNIPEIGTNAVPKGIYHNPVFHISDNIAWRNLRSYTPVVLYDSEKFGEGEFGSHYKMWFTGKSSAGYCIGYATSNPPENFSLKKHLTNQIIRYLWNIPVDKEDDKLQFEIQIDITNTFQSSYLLHLDTFYTNCFEYKISDTWKKWDLGAFGGIDEGTGQMRFDFKPSDFGFPTGRTYYIRIRARDDIFKGQWVSVSAESDPLMTPDHLTAQVLKDNTIFLSWQSAVPKGNNTGISVIYYIFRSETENGKYTNIGTSLEPATTFIDQTVQGGKQYYYSVRAQRGEETTSLSEQIGPVSVWYVDTVAGSLKTYPNPVFQFPITIFFLSDTEGTAQITLYDSYLRVIKNFETDCRIGKNYVSYNGLDKRGRILGNGVYILVVTLPDARKLQWKLGVSQ